MNRSITILGDVHCTLRSLAALDVSLFFTRPSRGWYTGILGAASACSSSGEDFTCAFAYVTCTDADMLKPRTSLLINNSSTSATNFHNTMLHFQPDESPLRPRNDSSPIYRNSCGDFQKDRDGHKYITFLLPEDKDRTRKWIHWNFLILKLIILEQNGQGVMPSL